MQILPLPTLASFKKSLKEIEKVKKGSVTASTASSRGRSREKVTTNNSLDYHRSTSPTKGTSPQLRSNSPTKRNSNSPRASPSPTGSLLSQTKSSAGKVRGASNDIEAVQYVSPTDKKLNKLKRVLVDSYQTLLSQVDYYEKQVITNKSSSEDIRRSSSTPKPRSSSAGRLSTEKKSPNTSKGPFNPNAPNTFTSYSGPSADISKRSTSVPRDMKVSSKSQTTLKSFQSNVNEDGRIPNKEFTPVSANRQRDNSIGGSRLPPPTPVSNPSRSTTPTAVNKTPPRGRSKSPSSEGRVQPSSSHGLFNRLHNTGTASRNATPTPSQIVINTSKQTSSTRPSLEGTTPMHFNGAVHSPTASSAIKTRGKSPPRANPTISNNSSRNHPSMESPSITKRSQAGSSMVASGRGLLTPTPNNISKPVVTPSSAGSQQLKTPTSNGLREKSMTLLSLASSKPSPGNQKANKTTNLPAATISSSTNKNKVQVASLTTQNKPSISTSGNKSSEVRVNSHLTTHTTAQATPTQSTSNGIKTINSRNVTPSNNGRLNNSKSSTPISNTKKQSTTTHPSRSTTPVISKAAKDKSSHTPASAKVPEKPREGNNKSISADELFKRLGVQDSPKQLVVDSKYSESPTKSQQSNSPKPTIVLSSIPKNSSPHGDLKKSGSNSNLSIISAGSVASATPPPPSPLVRTKSNDSATSTGSTGAVRSIRGGRPSIISTPSSDNIQVSEQRTITRETSLQGIFCSLDNAENDTEDSSVSPTPTSFSSGNLRMRSESTEGAPQDSPIHSINKALLMYNNLDSVFSDTAGVIVSSNTASDPFMDSMAFHGCNHDHETY